jgi:hypothetical protein
MSQITNKEQKVSRVRKWTMKEREELLSAWASSGMSVWSFAKSKSIAPTTVYGWIKKRGVKSEVTPKFAKLEVITAPKTIPVEVVFSTGMKLRFDPSVSAEKLSEWVGVIQKEIGGKR